MDVINVLLLETYVKHALVDSIYKMVVVFKIMEIVIPLIN